MQPVTRHLLTLGAIFALTAILYGRVTVSYFCGFDDFTEVHRAAFEDKIHPGKILTTTHYNSFKYRPINRALTLASYLMAPNSAIPFRVRNLLFHGLTIAAVYWLGWILFGSYKAVAAASLLFAIHPLSNQSIIGAVMTGTLAHALLLFSLALFIRASESGRIGRLILALLIGTLSVYTYESNIVAPGLMAGWMALDYLFRRRLPSITFLIVFVLVGGLLFGSYLGVRHFLVQENIPSPPISRLSTMAVNLALYAAGILVPFDMVLASKWFGIPMPKELLYSDLSQVLPFGFAGLFLAAGAGIVVLTLPFLIAGPKRILRWLGGLQWQPILFLLLAGSACVLPLVLFTEHPSETYVYLPVAYFCLILGHVLSGLRSRPAFIAIVGVLVVLYTTATWVRNQQVVRCASTAQAILSNLPEAQWVEGPWHVSLAKPGDEVTSMPFAFYNYYGLDSIGMPGYGADAIQFAIQLVTGNGQLKAEELEPDQFVNQCVIPGPKEACYWVHEDGSVTAAGQH